jgi:hypothetical protein
MIQSKMKFLNQIFLCTANQLDLAILPLFSMAQFVTELIIFKDMPDRIGPPSEPGSLPVLPPFTKDGPYTHPNTTGVCDDKAQLDRFKDIASTVKENANMEGVLVAIQFVPYEVVCLVHPLINSEDFPEGVVMDGTGAIGLDLLTDPTSRLYGKTVVKSEEIIIIGPLALKECQDGKECDSLVESAIIAALPAVYGDHIIEIDGKEYTTNQKCQIGTLFDTIRMNSVFFLRRILCRKTLLFGP